MGELLTGRARGIPAAALRHILERAGGVPLYAVELTRMLIDRGQLVPIHGAYRLAGALTDADLPDSLLGLLGARIDALPAPERSVLRAAATLGRRFSPDALGAVTGLRRAELQRRVASLVEREVLAYDDELRSPASGQVAFVQDLVRELAYRTLSRAERQSAHLAAAAHYSALGDEDLVEATAAHMAAAHAADPSHPDAASIAARASSLLRQAARRALSIHAPERALEDLERALAMPGDDAERGALLEESADAARRAGRLATAEMRLRELVDRSAAGAAADRDRYRAELASVLLMAHHNAAALAELEAAIDAGVEETSPAAAELIGQLARAHLLVGRDGEAVRWGRRALEIARGNGIGAIAVDALVTVGTGRFRDGDEAGGIADLRAAVDEARAAGLQSAELRARNNLAWLEVVDDPRHTLEIAREGGELASRIGMLDWAVQMAELGCLAAIDTGDWDWALATQARFEERPISTAYRIDLAGSIATIQLLRGAADPLAAIDALGPLDPATDPQDAAALDHARAWQALLAGDLEAAAGLAETVGRVALGAERFRALTLRARARAWSGAADELRVAIADLDALRVNGRAAAATRATLGAALVALDGPKGAAGPDYAVAAEMWRSLELRLHLALCLLEWRRFAGGDTLEELRAVIDGIGAHGLAPMIEAVAAIR